MRNTSIKGRPFPAAWLAFLVALISFALPTPAYAATTDADLQLTQTVSRTFAAPAESLVYTLTITNLGPAAATNITLIDTLPSGVTFVSVTGATGLCDEGGALIICQLADVPSGGSVVIFIEITINGGASGGLLNTATVSTATPDPNLVNNSTTVSTAVVTGQVTNVEANAFSREGLWTPVNHVQAGGGQYLINGDVLNPNVSLVAVFEGTLVEIIYAVGPDFGTFAIEIDNTVVRTVNAYAPVFQLAFVSTIDYAGSGAHILRVYPVNSRIAIDAIHTDIVTPPPTPDMPTLQSPSGATYSGTPPFVWSNIENVEWYELRLYANNRLTQTVWYLATEVCNTDTCSVVLPQPLLHGTFGWQVRAFNATGGGLWSPREQFYYWSTPVVQSNRITKTNVQVSGDPTAPTVRVQVEGIFSNACEFLSFETQSIQGPTITLTVRTSSPAQAMCGQSLHTFDRRYTLDVTGLAPGDYDVMVNGTFAGSFTIEP